jgi:dihydrofolate reductase
VVSANTKRTGIQLLPLWHYNVIIKETQLMIKAIFAVTDDNVVGYEGKLPWPHSKIDMSWFVNNTRGDMVFMGSKTWDAPDMKSPLPNRPNIVISRQDPSMFEGADCVLSDVGMITEYDNRKAFKTKFSTKWIIGGAEIIMSTQDLIEEYYITRFHKSLEEYDKQSYHFPKSVKRLPLDFMLIDFERTFVREHKDLSFEIWSRKF